MSGGSLGLRSGSYGSLQQQQLQNGVLPIQTTPPPALPRKTSKMLKEKEKLLHWIFKFAGRKKVGMLFLSVVSAAVFVWVLYVGKGEEGQERDSIERISVNDSFIFGYRGSSPVDSELYTNEDNNSSLVDFSRSENIVQLPPDNNSSLVGGLRSENIVQPPLDNNSSLVGVLRSENIVQAPPDSNSSLVGFLRSKNIAQPPPPPPPPPPSYFLGYTLPPGNPCETFTLPPPPADKKRTGPRPCPVCYLPVEEAIALMPKDPSPSPILRNLTYIYDENLTRSSDSFGGSDFGGYPSLKQRDDSHNIRESMTVHCGFVKGKPGRQTGFDMDESDLNDMEQCYGVVVASAIFGAYDLIQQPKNISDFAKETVCFYMFVDEESEAYMRNNNGLDDNKRIGLWRIVVVHNLPYTDARRNGKVPKLLVHRMFPNARYSLWIDGKLELVVDPYQILERFLWRKNATFAISRHYKRFDSFTEAEANKAAGKYDNASIDFQIEFYRREGLTPYSEAKLPITSDVPEGCVIIKEHIPISNLFTCIWFNEVDRFTSRDQISFSTARDKILSKVDWHINMFLDCERRNFVVQGYHRDVLEHWPPVAVDIPALPIAIFPPPLTVDRYPPPPVLVNELPIKSLPDVLPERVGSAPTRKFPARRSRRFNSRRHRKVAAGNRDTNSI